MARKLASKAAVKKQSVRRKSTKSARVKKAEFKLTPWISIETEQLNPLMLRQFVVGNEIMIARIVFKKGALVPMHSHHNEQVTFILDGALKFWIDGKEIMVNAGEVLTIPPHMPHKAEAVADTVDVDIFCPPREDWINKTDHYLRGSK